MWRSWILGFGIWIGLCWPLAAQRGLEKAGFEAILRLQIWLDNQHFGVGAIDGRAGGFTQKSIRWINIRDGQPADDWGRLLALAQRDVPNALASHRVAENDFRYIGTMPEDIPAQAKLLYLPYASMAEMVAERYHCSEALLRRLNPHANLTRLAAGSTLVVPNVRFVFAMEGVPAAIQFPKDAQRSAHYIVIDTRERMGIIFAGTSVLAAFPITPGKSHLVPHGRWRMVNMGTLPQFRWDEQMLREGRRGTDSYLLPPGPNSLIGVLWAGLDKSGIGLHGTSTPEVIGRSLSAGCVRFANWDAIRLPNFLRPGSEVIIR